MKSQFKKISCWWLFDCFHKTAFVIGHYQEQKILKQSVNNNKKEPINKKTKQKTETHCTITTRFTAFAVDKHTLCQSFAHKGNGGGKNAKLCSKVLYGYD